VHALADLPVGEALADELEDALLLLGEGIEPLVVLLTSTQALHDALGRQGIEERPARGYLADRLDQVVATDLLEDVSGRARHDGVEERLIIGVRGEHEAARLGHRVAHLAAHLNPTPVRKSHVEHGHVGPRRGNAGVGLRGAAGLADNLHIGLEADEVRQTTADDLVIVEQEHPDRHASSVASAQTTRSGWAITPSGRPLTVLGWAWAHKARDEGVHTMTDDVISLLTPEGEYVEHPDYPLVVDTELLRTLYRDIVLTRRTDVESTALQRTGELGLWCPVLGQEGAQVGAAHAMRPEDYGFTTYREVGVFQVRGVDPVELLHLYRGTTHASWDPRRVGLGVFTIVIGSHALHSVGYAMGIQRDGADQAVLSCFGDGATSTGDVHEAMVFAAAFNSPVVFFVQNNQWAISVPVSRQARAPLAARSAGYGITSVRIDGNDVLASLAVTRAMLDRAREGGGPAFIEAITYRRGPHTTSDDPTRYRDEGELQQWESRDPLDRLVRYMHRVGAIDEDFVAAVDAEAEELGQRLRDAIRGMVDPDPLGMFDHAYAEPHPQVTADRSAMAAYLASEEMR